MKRPEYLLSIYIRKIFFNRGFRLEDNKGDFIHYFFSLLLFFLSPLCCCCVHTHYTYKKRDLCLIIIMIMMGLNVRRSAQIIFISRSTGVGTQGTSGKKNKKQNSCNKSYDHESILSVVRIRCSDGLGNSR